MPFRDIEGQDRPLSLLTSALMRGTLHHGYLFGGPGGVGKELAARVLMQAANCERNDGDACGVCGPCRRIASRAHPDVVWVLPEAEQVARGWAGRTDFSGVPSREIKIEQIRRLGERLSLKAIEARRKFGLILSADAMNVPAQNALLKTLEEPPDDTTLILVSAAPHALLPTIRSRCLKLSFNPLPIEIVARKVAELAKLDPAAARLCAAMGDGSIAAALTFDPKALEGRRGAIERLESFGKRSIRDAFTLAAELASDRASAEASLELFKTWYRDVAFIASTADAAPASLFNQDLFELASDAAKRLGPTEPLRRIELCSRALGRVRGAASPRLQLEQLFLLTLFPSLSS